MNSQSPGGSSRGTANRARRLGNGAGVAAFLLVIGLSIVHDGFDQWTRAMDAEVLGWAHSRFHPTLVICAAAAALVAGAVGYLVGRAMDQRRGG